ncbi:hypothetical protein [Haloarchaeobius litoreus]|uniref:Uncharacterized protein n=1 Tax=Haloarchaeobius litoreus TaxID=755306 RepID=A0ABD6DDV9_9EURY|nr:hypothetical protein [Haloarchaeobius litoreus]
MEPNTNVTLATLSVLLLTMSAYFLYVWFGVQGGESQLTNTETIVLLLLSVFNAVIAIGFGVEAIRRSLS